jgi:hypothetical protein
MSAGITASAGKIASLPRRIRAYDYDRWHDMSEQIINPPFDAADYQPPGKNIFHEVFPISGRGSVDVILYLHSYPIATDDVFQNYEFSLVLYLRRGNPANDKIYAIVQEFSNPRVSQKNPPRQQHYAINGPDYKIFNNLIR